VKHTSGDVGAAADAEKSASAAKVSAAAVRGQISIFPFLAKRDENCVRRENPQKRTQFS